MSKTVVKSDIKSNGLPTEEEKAQLLLQKKNKERQQEFLNKYNKLCQEYGMTLEPQIQMIIHQKR